MLKLDRNTKNVIKFSIAVIAVGYILYFTSVDKYTVWHYVFLVLAGIALYWYAKHVFNDN